MHRLDCTYKTEDVAEASSGHHRTTLQLLTLHHDGHKLANPQPVTKPPVHEKVKRPTLECWNYILSRWNCYKGLHL